MPGFDWGLAFVSGSLTPYPRSRGLRGICESMSSARRHRALNKDLNCSPRPRVGVSGAQETMCGVMTEIDAAKLPHELVHIEVPTKVRKIDGAPNESGQQEAPLTFHFQDSVSDAALDVVELEQASRHWTTAGQASALSPSEPIANQRQQSGEAFFGRHRRLDNVGCRDLCHMRQQLDLNIFFRAEMREQPAFRHTHLIGQNSKRNAGQARSAHQSQPLVEYPFAG